MALLFLFKQPTQELQETAVVKSVSVCLNRRLQLKGRSVTACLCFALSIQLRNGWAEGTMSERARVSMYVRTYVRMYMYMYTHCLYGAADARPIEAITRARTSAMRDVFTQVCTMFLHRSPVQVQCFPFFFFPFLLRSPRRCAFNVKAHNVIERVRFAGGRRV